MTTLPMSNGLRPVAARRRYTRTLQPHEHAHLAHFLEAYLTEHRCSTRELADQLTISANYLNSMKSARNLRIGQAPTYRIVGLMATRLGVPVEDLLGPAQPPLPLTVHEDAGDVQVPDAPPAVDQPPWDRLLEALVQEVRLLREMLERHLCAAQVDGDTEGEGHADDPPRTHRIGSNI